MKDVIIIGAGLSGLTLAYFLRNHGLDILILEGRDRSGGRILTVSKDQVQVEMGATWIHPQHKKIVTLIKKLNLEIFEQHMGASAFYEPMPNSPHQLVPLPLHQEPSYRLKGGSSLLIHTLEKQLEKAKLRYNCTVHKIQEDDQHLNIDTNKGDFKAKFVVSTLPPFLFQKTIEMVPPLTHGLKDILLNTHTWMGESIKIAVTYSEPFWKEKASSGTIFSNSGPVTEMYDHSNFEQNTFSLKGFLNPAFHSISKKERLKLVISQLKKYYGVIAESYISYEELIWKQQTQTSLPYDTLLFPHQNNGHQIFRQSFMQGRFLIAGTETAVSYPGYMEGAIDSAKETARKIEAYFSRTGFNS